MDQMTVACRLEGGCLCGAVRYRVEPGTADSVYCHCRMCQRSAGAPVLAWFSVPREHVSYIKGAARAYRSSPVAAREFCADCGTQLLWRPDSGAKLDVNTATLDDPAIMPPRYHIWRASRLAWFETADGLPRFDEGGPDT